MNNIKIQKDWTATPSKNILKKAIQSIEDVINVDSWTLGPILLKMPPKYPVMT